MIFVRLSLPLSLILGALSLLAVIGGEQVNAGWQINIASRNEYGVWQLTLMDVDRRLASRVALPVEVYSPPLFSPNGALMVWDDLNAMRLIRLSGQDDTMQVLGATPQIWSANSRYFAFTRNGPGRLVFRTYIVAVDEAGNPIDTTPMTLNGEDILRGYPLWSPDSERLAFLAFDDIQSELFLASADGSDLHPLLPAMTTIQTMTWSPDSEQLAFAWQPADDRTTTVLSRMRVDGSVEEVIAGGLSQWIAFMSWSPDGRFIAFASSPVFQSGLYVIDVETGDITGPIDSGLAAREARWSPDGERLVFLSGRDNDLYVVGRDGCHIAPLTKSDRFHVLMP